MFTKAKKLLLLFLALTLIFVSTACQYLPGLSKESSDANKQEANGESQGEAQNSAEVKSGEGAKVATNSFSPQNAGPEPDPQSVFAKMKEEEQQQLIAWLDQVQSSFEVMNKAFGQFGEESGIRNALQEGKSITEVESYQNLKSACQAEMNKINQLDIAGLPDSTNALTDSALAVSSWYGQFFIDLEQQNLAADGMTDWFNKKSDEVTQVIQNFLDQLSKLNS